MPPLQALAALHALWFVTLIPLTVLASRRLPLPWLRCLALTLSLLGLLGLASVAVHEALTWLPQAAAEERRYLPQRCCFVLATQTDVPIVQVCVSGLVCWLGTRRRRKAAKEEVLPLPIIAMPSDTDVTCASRITTAGETYPIQAR